MSRLISRIRTPVKREGSENYVLITLLSFGLSVGLTRLFLELTGYPQLGNQELHIAHVLWGGLLLFIAALLPLIFANRWVYIWGALLAGVGVGLFIDEVGKFITQNNDYFYPPAAPIIYAFFLLTVLVYTRVRRPPVRDARAELYRAFEALEEVLDHDLDPVERADLEARLNYIIETAEAPNHVRLARELLQFLASEELALVDRTPTRWDRFMKWLRRFEERRVRRIRLKAVLTGLLAGLGLIALLDLSELIRAALDPSRLEAMAAEMIASGRVGSAAGLGWFSARLALEGVVGFILVLAAMFMILNREKRGISLAYMGLLLSLTTVNLLVFFFEQFATILTAGVQFAALLGILYYRRRFIQSERSAPDEL